MEANEFKVQNRSSIRSKSSKQWFAFYVKPRHEKKASKRLEDNFDIFCPLKKERVKWSDRWKTVIKPYIPGYIFAFVTEQERILILNDRSVFRTVCIKGRPAAIREEEIDAVKGIIGHPNVDNMRIESFSAGDRVHVTGGELADVNGIIVTMKGGNAVLRLESLNCNITFTLRQELLEKCS